MQGSISTRLRSWFKKRTVGEIQKPSGHITGTVEGMVGTIDGFIDGVMCGWAFDPRHYPVRVSVLMDGVEIASGLAIDFRPDLVGVAGSLDGKCAFHVPALIEIPREEISRIVVTANGVPLNWTDGAVLPASYPEIDIALPDEEMIFLVNGHRDRHAFALSRRATAVSIKLLLAASGVSLDEFSSILDFGCGCGRVLAGWQGMLDPKVELHGADINEAMVRFCQVNIPYAKCFRSNYLPPLALPDKSVDLVYAASVFTHLTEEAAFAWGHEIARLVKPGGIALISYHGSYYAPELARLSKSGVVSLEENGIYVHVHEEESIWLGHNAYATFMTSSYMRDLFRGFELVRLHPGISHGPNPFASYQDIAVLRRRGHA